MGGRCPGSCRPLFLPCRLFQKRKLLPLLQLLLLSKTGNEKLDAGRLALFELQVGSAEEPALVPIVISLIEREQIFAPKLADEALWTSSIGDPISIWPEVGHE